jgi:hypothetical protein
VFDGALKSNQILEDAATFAHLDAPEDLASDGIWLFVADGFRVLRYAAAAGSDSGAEGTVVASFEQPVTALACLGSSALAVALGGREVQIVGGAHDGKRVDAANGRPFVCANAICVSPDGKLIITDGSQKHPTQRWKNDLMELGASGRVVEWDFGSGAARELATGMAYTFGACPANRGSDATIWACESWRHRVIKLGGAQSGAAVIDAATGSPPSSCGPSWSSSCCANRSFASA